MDKEHTKNTRDLKGIGRLQYNVVDEKNTSTAVLPVLAAVPALPGQVADPLIFAQRTGDGSLR